MTIDANQKSSVFVAIGGTDANPVSLIGLTIQNGKTLDDGGGINNYGAFTLKNCTVSRNSAYAGGGIHYGPNSTLNSYNSIIALNTASSGSDIYRSGGTINGYNTLTSYWGTYDSTKPLFTDAENGDYTLAEGSQAINVGNNDYVTPETDLAGNPQISGGIVDLGTYEYQFAPQLSAPTGLTLSVSGTTVSASWNVVTYANQYIVEYSTSSDFTEIQQQTAAETSVSISGLAYNTQYYFRVKAADTTGAYLNPNPSESISVKTPSAPQLDAPTGVTLTASGTDITVTWNSVEKANRYVIFYSTDETFKTQSYKTTTETHLTISDFEYDTTYYFRIQARDSNLVYPNSKYSDTQSIIIPGETEKISVSVVLSTTAPTGATCEELEESLDLAYRGDTVYAQVWMKNIDSSANGIIGGYLDLSYSADAFSVQGVTSGAYYSQLNNYYSTAEAGKITLLGGMAEMGQVSYGVNKWVLLGYVTLSVIGDGTTTIAASAPMKDGQALPEYNLTRNLEGTLITDAIKFGSQTIETKAMPLPSPTNLTITSGGANRHLVSWDAVENASGYTLAYSVDQTNWATVKTTSHSYLVTGLTYGAQVSYKVMAQGNGGRWDDSEYSDAVTLAVCPMDMNSDGVINMADYSILSQAWFTREGESGFDVRADINGDGAIAPADYMFLSTNWLKKSDDPTIVYPAAKAATFADGDFVEELGTDLDVDWDVF